MLSDLFLDNDISGYIGSISMRLSQLPLTIKQLELILIYAVYPVCRSNLWGIAGVWNGFDETWIAERIAMKRGGIVRQLDGFLGQRFANACEEWQVIKSEIRHMRRSMNMMENPRSKISACVRCHSDYVYEDKSLFVCPECAYEWPIAGQ